MANPRALIALLVVLSAVPGSCSSTEWPPGDAGAIVLHIFDALDVQADQWFHEGQYLRTVHVNRMRTAYDPGDVRAYSLAAWLLWSSGRDAEAQEEFAAAVRANPTNYEPYFEAGMHWSGRRDDHMAGLWLSQACIQGGPVEAWKMLSHTYRKLGLIDDAISVMIRAKELDPTDPLIDLNLQWLREAKARG